MTDSRWSAHTLAQWKHFLYINSSHVSGKHKFNFVFSFSFEKAQFVLNGPIEKKSRKYKVSNFLFSFFKIREQVGDQIENEIELVRKLCRRLSWC